ncbi:DUF454 family protein [Chloroflexota bacterium]
MPDVCSWRIDPVFFRGYNAYMIPISYKLKRRIFVIAGIIALGLGVIGIVLPVLPTTPFFCCLQRSAT